MRHVSRTHRVALDWLFDRINLDLKIQIKYIDTNKQFADILTKGNFTRDEWDHLLCLFNISHFSSTGCSEVMSKRTQEESGEERVTAKSKPMMNLVSRCTERTPDVLASTASESPGKTRYESQLPLSPQTEQHLRTGRFVLDAYSSSYSEWNADKNWSSQEWKPDIETYERSGRPDETYWRMTRKVRPGFSHEETLHDGTAQSVRNEETLRDRSGRPDFDSQEEARPQQFVIGNDEADLELSVESRSFVNRVNDQVRKRQKNFQRCRRWRRTFYDMVNVYGCNDGISSIHGEELPEQLSLHCEHDRPHTHTNVRHIYEIGV